MTYQIEKMPKSHIAYMRRVGPYGADNYALMKKFKEWAKFSFSYRLKANNPTFPAPFSNGTFLS